MTENVIKEMTNIIEKKLTHYKTDWYDYDLPKVKESNAVIIGIRKTGTHLLKLDEDKKNFDNADCFCAASLYNKQYFLLTESGVKKITRKKALEKAFEIIKEEKSKTEPFFTMSDYVKNYL